MKTFRSIIDKELLFEVKNDSSVGSLKVFYDIDIKISDEDAMAADQKQQPQNPQPEAAPAAPNQNTATPPQPAAPATPPVEPQPVQESVLKEEDIRKKIQGEVTLTKEDADNIQTVDDLLDFLGDKKHKGENIIDDLTVEVITSLLGNQDAMNVQDIVSKDDQIIITVMYGYKKDNSIGFKILKRHGINSISTIMLKDNEVLDSKFDESRFNSQLIDYRNDWLNK